MRVRMKATISGTRDGADWPKAGETLDVSDDEGKHLCAGGLAEPVAAPEQPEKRPAAKRAEKRA